jgi:hypothetical protein
MRFRVAPQLRGRSQEQLVKLIHDGYAYLDGDTIVPYAAGGALPIGNNAESGTAGATVTTANSGGTNSQAWDGVTIGTNMALTYDNAAPMHGAFSFKFALTAAATAITHMDWIGALPSLTELYGAFYTRSNLATATSSLRGISFRNAGAQVSGIKWPSGAGNGWLFMDSAGADIAGQTHPPAQVANTWYRYEWHVIFNTAAGVTAELREYTGDSTTMNGSPCTLTAVNMGAAIDDIWFGMTTANFSSTAGDFIMFDSLYLTTAGWPGPGPYNLSQFARPDADVTDGGWTNEVGSNVNLFASVDEAVASDADLIQSGDSPATGDMVELNLSDITP